LGFPVSEPNPARGGQNRQAIRLHPATGENLGDGEAIGGCTTQDTPLPCYAKLRYPSSAEQLQLRNEVLTHAHPKLILWWSFPLIYGQAGDETYSIYPEARLPPTDGPACQPRSRHHHHEKMHRHRTRRRLVSMRAGAGRCAKPAGPSTTQTPAGAIATSAGIISTGIVGLRDPEVETWTARSWLRVQQ